VDDRQRKWAQLTANGTRPTAAGQRILEMGESLLRSAQGIENEAMLLRKVEAGELRFGIGPMLAPFLTHTLAEFYTTGRHVNLEVVIEPIGRMLELLLTDRIEFFLSVIPESTPNPEIELRKLSMIQVGYFVRKDHPLINAGLNVKGATAAYLLATPRLNVAEQWADKNPPQSLPSAGHVQCDNIEVMKELAISSDAILLALAPALEPELSQGKYRKLPIEELEYNELSVGIAKLASRSLSPAETHMPAMQAKLFGQ